METQLAWVTAQTLAVLHSHSALESGGFEAVFERNGRCVKFEWDAEEQLLSVMFAAYGMGVPAQDWRMDARISHPDGSGLFEEIASEIQEQKL